LINVIKSELQQATSPEEVHHIIQTIIAQGLPPAAGEELHVYAAEFHDATALLRTAEEDHLVARLVDNAHHWADLTIDQSTQKNQRACQAGCAFCCYLPSVLVTAAEAVHLAKWLQNHCTTEELAALKNRLAHRVYAQTAASSSPQTTPPLACPLLQDNHCMAYEARPLKCRGWNSLRLEDCEQAYGHGQTSHKVPIDTYAYVMSNTVLNGLCDSVTQAGLDGATYELSDALSHALDIPDIVQRWQRGEPIFTKSTRY
jgi:Fe-S-cluster containining protein